MNDEALGRALPRALLVLRVTLERTRASLCNGLLARRVLCRPMLATQDRFEPVVTGNRAVEKIIHRRLFGIEALGAAR
jgi:hypothetical protein